ncbi:MAG: hypothetical protein D6729_15220 [Deltaproteobacteria bacterium]|nr:MAG: hypothetical protein D6729_15220 [Deltaproteobacteria bacterium]
MDRRHLLLGLGLVLSGGALLAPGCGRTDPWTLDDAACAIGHLYLGEQVGAWRLADDLTIPDLVPGPGGSVRTRMLGPGEKGWVVRLDPTEGALHAEGPGLDRLVDGDGSGALLGTAGGEVVFLDSEGGRTTVAAPIARRHGLTLRNGLLERNGIVRGKVRAVTAHSAAWDATEAVWWIRGERVGAFAPAPAPDPPTTLAPPLVDASSVYASWLSPAAYAGRWVEAEGAAWATEFTVRGVGWFMDLVGSDFVAAGPTRVVFRCGQGAGPPRQMEVEIPPRCFPSDAFVGADGEPAVLMPCEDGSVRTVTAAGAEAVRVYRPGRQIHAARAIGADAFVWVETGEGCGTRGELLAWVRGRMRVLDVLFTADRCEATPDPLTLFVHAGRVFWSDRRGVHWTREACFR